MATLQVTIRQQMDSTTSEGIVRGHRVLVDRPREKGGADRGPLGGELLLVALGGCFMSTLIAAAKARGLNPSDFQVTVRGELGGRPERFQSATIEVHAPTATATADPMPEGSGSAETLKRCVEIAERSCIVTNTLKAGMPVEVILASININTN